jgi:CheY-like chemotaxis protein
VFVPPMATYLRMLFYRLLRSVRGDYHHMSSVRDSSSSLQNCRNNVVELSLPPQEAEANTDGSSVPIRAAQSGLNNTGGAVIGRAPPAQWMAGLTALLVDDSRICNRLTGLLLTRLGCKCLAATDGAKAVEIVRNLGSTEVIDFVLMDDHMPIMHGHEASNTLRAMGFRNPIIGHSSSGDLGDIAEFKAAGADAVLSRPLDLQDLQSLLHQLLPLLGTRI